MNSHVLDILKANNRAKVMSKIHNDLNKKTIQPYVECIHCNGRSTEIKLKKLNYTLWTKKIEYVSAGKLLYKNFYKFELKPFS